MYLRPSLLFRNQVQMNMNAYNNFHQHNNNYNSVSTQSWNNRMGSRRNSLKGYSAPPPPPMPPSNMAYRNDQVQMRSMQQNNMNQNYKQRSSYIPSDPVRELKDIVRRSHDEDVGWPDHNFLINCVIYILVFARVLKNHRTISRQCFVKRIILILIPKFTNSRAICPTTIMNILTNHSFAPRVIVLMIISHQI